MIDKYNDDLKLLNKNNLLIKANYNLTLIENRFYLTILYNMQKTAKGNYVGIIPKNEFLRLSGKTTNNTTIGINKILKSLESKRVEIQEFKKSSKKPDEYDFPIITGYKYDRKTSTYTIELSTILYDLLLEYMEVGYTPLNLGVILGLNNFYAQRMYELLRLWSGTKNTINYKIDYLRECFDLEYKYPRYNNFKERVIDPSIEALNSTEKFKITYEEVKSGKKVVAVDFIVEDLEDRRYFDKQKEIKDEKFSEVEIFESNIKKNIPLKSVSIKKLNNNMINDIGDIIDVSCMSKGIQFTFKRKYKNIDFTQEDIQEGFYYCVGVMMDRDNVEILGTQQYKLLTIIFDSYLERLELNKINDFYCDIENEMFWPSK